MVELESEPVGFVTLDPIGEGYEGVDPEALEIGAVVHTYHWGSGIAGEAGLAVAVDAFARAGLARLYATVDPRKRAVPRGGAKVPDARLVSANDEEEVYELSAARSRT